MTSLKSSSTVVKAVFWLKKRDGKSKTVFLFIDGRGKKRDCKYCLFTKLKYYLSNKIYVTARINNVMYACINDHFLHMCILIVLSSKKSERWGEWWKLWKWSKRWKLSAGSSLYVCKYTIHQIITVYLKIFAQFAIIVSEFTLIYFS